MVVEKVVRLTMKITAAASPDEQSVRQDRQYDVQTQITSNFVVWTESSGQHAQNQNAAGSYVHAVAFQTGLCPSQDVAKRSCSRRRF